MTGKNQEPATISQIQILIKKHYLIIQNLLAVEGLGRLWGNSKAEESACDPWLGLTGLLAAGERYHRIISLDA